MNHAESNDEEGEDKEKDSNKGEEDSESVFDATDEVEKAPRTTPRWKTRKTNHTRRV
jgi:hypothetical protein